MFKEFGVQSSFSFEASANGSDEKAGFEISDYEKMGEQFVQILGNYLVRKHIVIRPIALIFRETFLPPRNTKSSVSTSGT